MQSDIVEMLAAAQECVHLGMRLSRQGSYARRSPDPLSLPYFNKASRLLNEVLKSSSNNLNALMMLSQVSECLLDFDAAAAYLCKAFDGGEPKSKKSLKRLALLLENAKFWKNMLITPIVLSELGKYLVKQNVGPNDRTTRLTYEWLKNNVKQDPNEVLKSLEQHGAFSDFQILSNLVYG